MRIGDETEDSYNGIQTSRTHWEIECRNLRHPKWKPRLGSHCPLLACPVLVLGFRNAGESPLVCGGGAPANWIPLSGCQMPAEMPADAGVKGGEASALWGVGAINGSSGGALVLYGALDPSCNFSCCKEFAWERFKEDMALVRSLLQSVIRADIWSIKGKSTYASSCPASVRLWYAKFLQSSLNLDTIFARSL